MDALSKSETQGEFSVFWWDQSGSYYPEKRFVSAKEAVDTAASLVSRPAALIGAIQKVMITDGGDCCNFEWQFGKGVVFGPGAGE